MLRTRPESCSDREDARLFQSGDHGVVAIHARDLAMDVVDDGGSGAGGSHQGDPGGAFVEPGQVGGCAEAWQVGQDWQRPVAVFRQRAVLTSLNQRQACAGAVEREIDGPREYGLTDFGAALERNQLDIDAGGPCEQKRAQA